MWEKATYKYDRAELKLEFFRSPEHTVTWFLKFKGMNTNSGAIVLKTKGRSQEKEEFKTRLLDLHKKEEEINMKTKTAKFYNNMRNVMMSHGQALVEYVEMKDGEWNTHIVPKFKDVKEASEVLKQVRTFNWDVNQYRDLWIRNNSEDWWKIANVQFIFTDWKEDNPNEDILWDDFIDKDDEWEL